MTTRTVRRLVLSLALLAAPAALAAPQPGEQLKVFHLRFAAVKDVNALLRGVVDLRRSAVNENDHSITVRAAPETIREIETLLKEWDVPPAGWQGRLVAETGAREVELAVFRLEQETFHGSFGGDEGKSGLDVQLRVRDLRPRSLDVEYEFLTRIAGAAGVPSFRRSESGRTQLVGRGEQVVVAATTEDERARLAKLLGVERAVRRVVLRLAPER
jgi:hypothetical protein